MSTGAILPPPRSPEKTGGLWSRLKKNLNLKEPSNALVLQRRNPLDPRQMNGDNIRRNTSHGDIMTENYLVANGNLDRVPVGKLGHRNSLKNVQLELANYDHENNILNSKPMPKKIVSPSESAGRELRKKNSLTLDSSMNRRELRRAATVSAIAHERHERIMRNGSERSFSSLSSDQMTLPRSAASPPSVKSRSPLDSQPNNTFGGKALWGKVRQQYAPTAVELGKAAPVPKLATFTQLWEVIFEIVKENGMLEFDEPDPRLWWRKVFVNLRKRHGKAKASSIADHLMQNPEVLSAIQTKLAGMVDTPVSPSAHMQSLPKPVKRRVKALKKLQYDMVKLESKFYEEVHQLECKYADMYAPILEQRREIVSGEIEPTDDQCEWPSDDDEEDEDEEDLAAEAEDKLKIEAGADEDIKGVRGFWLMAFKNVELLASMIQEHDEPILHHLSNVKVNFSAEPMGFTLEFHFSPNGYFTDKILTKSYEMRSEPDDEDPFSFEGPEIVACQGCVISWNKGKNVTVRTIKKKQKHQKSGATRMVPKIEQQDSFFNFFTPPEAADADEEDMDEETEALLQADYEIGHFIRERIVPRAVLYFTGEACDDDYGDDDDDDDEYQDDDDDDEADFDPTAKNAGGQGNKECKQQ